MLPETQDPESPALLAEYLERIRQTYSRELGDEAFDVAIQAVAVLAQRLARGEKIESPLKFAYGVARNIYLRMLRSKRRRRETPLDAPEHLTYVSRRARGEAQEECREAAAAVGDQIEKAGNAVKMATMAFAIERAFRHSDDEIDDARVVAFHFAVAESLASGGKLQAINSSETLRVLQIAPQRSFWGQFAGFVSGSTGAPERATFYIADHNCRWSWGNPPITQEVVGAVEAEGKALGADRVIILSSRFPASIGASHRTHLKIIDTARHKAAAAQNLRTFAPYRTRIMGRINDELRRRREEQERAAAARSEKNRQFRKQK